MLTLGGEGVPHLHPIILQSTGPMPFLRGTPVPGPMSIPEGGVPQSSPEGEIPPSSPNREYQSQDGMGTPLGWDGGNTLSGLDGVPHRMGMGVPHVRQDGSTPSPSGLNGGTLLWDWMGYLPGWDGVSHPLRSDTTLHQGLDGGNPSPNM